MEILKFRYVPSAMIKLDKPEISLMIEMAQRHYDSTCKQDDARANLPGS